MPVIWRKTDRPPASFGEDPNAPGFHCNCPSLCPSISSVTQRLLQGRGWATQPRGCDPDQHGPRLMPEWHQYSPCRCCPPCRLVGPHLGGWRGHETLPKAPERKLGGIPELIAEVAVPQYPVHVQVDVTTCMGAEAASSPFSLLTCARHGEGKGGPRGRRRGPAKRFWRPYPEMCRHRVQTAGRRCHTRESLLGSLPSVGGGNGGHLEAAAPPQAHTPAPKPALGTCPSLAFSTSLGSRLLLSNWSWRP